MGIFGNRKEEYDEDEVDSEIELETENENRKLRRSLRDLKSENRKSRKEPVKPWGKKERLLILVLMLSTIIISGILYLSSNSNSNFQFSIYNLQKTFGWQSNLNFQLPNINLDSLNIFKEETIEIHKK